MANTTRFTFPAEMADPSSDLFQAVAALYAAKYQNEFDVAWLVQTGVLVFMMHLGFMTLEAGSVQLKNKDNIIFKNFLTVAISAISYWVMGFSFAHGNNSDGNFRFIGGNADYFGVEAPTLDGAADFITEFNSTGFAIATENLISAYGQGFYFFQWAFAATAATIVSGAVAGRMKIEAYLIIATWITAFVYPVVTHWVWSTTGWLSAFSSEPAFMRDVFPEAAGMFDFAGSAVVHMTGGVAAFWGAYFVGPRIDYENAKGHNVPLVCMGTFFLWLGWYGFNCGSTLVFGGLLTGKVAVTTTLAPAAAVVTGMLLLKVTRGTWDLMRSLNCALAGLVSITAPCPLVEDWAAVVIGAIGAIFYIYAADFIKSKGIDDPVGAIAVHGVCGAWGALSVGIFANPALVVATYGATGFANFISPGSTGSYQFTVVPGYQFAIQLVGVLSIAAWVTAMTVPVFFVMKKLNFIRVSEADEIAGLDVSEHGASKAMSETILESDSKA